MILLSGSFISEIDLGIVTITGSSALNWVVSMKKVNRRKATSHIAVMSTFVLFLGTFTFGIL
jgi:hypothetical protein